MYDLSFAGSGSFTTAHLRQRTQASNLYGQTFQGYTAMGSWLYTIDGTPEVIRFH